MTCGNCDYTAAELGLSPRPQILPDILRTPSPLYSLRSTRKQPQETSSALASLIQFSRPSQPQRITRSRIASRTGESNSARAQVSGRREEPRVWSPCLRRSSCPSGIHLLRRCRSSRYRRRGIPEAAVDASLGVNCVSVRLSFVKFVCGIERRDEDSLS